MRCPMRPALALSHSVSLSVELWQMNLQGKIAERQPEATEASLSLLFSIPSSVSPLPFCFCLYHVERMCTWWCFCCKPACNVGWLFQALHDFEFPVLSFIRSSLSMIIASQRKDKIVLLSSDVPSSKNGSTDWFSESSLGKVKTCYCRHVAHLRS